MKILITGFPAYSGEAVNPTQEVLNLLPDQIMGVDIVKVELPAVYNSCLKKAMEVIETHKPDVLLSLGMASGRSSVAVETIAINLMDSPKTDNAGVKYEDMKIKDDGPTAYFMPFPVKHVLKRILQNGIPAEVSYSAGTFISNHLMYGLIYLFEKKGMDLIYGHLGLPLLPSQAVNRADKPSMSARDSASAVITTIETLITDFRPQGKYDTGSGMPSDR